METPDFSPEADRPLWYRWRVPLAIAGVGAALAIGAVAGMAQGGDDPEATPPTTTAAPTTTTTQSVYDQMRAWTKQWGVAIRGLQVTLAELNLTAVAGPDQFKPGVVDGQCKELGEKVETLQRSLPAPDFVFSNRLSSVLSSMSTHALICGADPELVLGLIQEDAAEFKQAVATVGLD